MFGYVIANPDALTPEQLARYKSCYCGLCRNLKKRHGQLSRLTLTYDMTFLVLLLESMYEPDMRTGEERCAAHPVHPHMWSESDITDYAADMNILLAYQNLMDDWQDEHSYVSRAEASMLAGRYSDCAERYPEKSGFMERCLAELSELEKRGETDPDAGARCFGALMGELFVYYPQDTVWGCLLYTSTANYYTARFIGHYGCDKYYLHNKELRFQERRQEIMKQVDSLDLGL